MRYKVRLVFDVIEDTAKWDTDAESMTPVQLQAYIEDDIGAERWLRKEHPDAVPKVDVWYA